MWVRVRKEQQQQQKYLNTSVSEFAQKSQWLGRRSMFTQMHPIVLQNKAL